MPFKSILSAIFLLITTVLAHAGDITIEDSYFRTSGPTAKSGAAFFVVVNHGDQPDRLIGVASDLAKKVEIHTHVDAGDGVMQMRPVEGGLPIPAQSDHLLKRGGDHVMFMGLTRRVANGDTVKLTLTFEVAGEIVVDVPVDLDR